MLQNIKPYFNHPHKDHILILQIKGDFRLDVYYYNGLLYVRCDNDPNSIDVFSFDEKDIYIILDKMFKDQIELNVLYYLFICLTHDIQDEKLDLKTKVTIFVNILKETIASSKK